MNQRNLCLSIIISILLISWSANPPQGNSGAPFDRTCARAGCHSSTGSISGSVDITGIPDEVIPGETYDFSIRLSVSSGNADRGGFQMVAVDVDDNDSGTFSNAGASATTSAFQGRTYLEHQPAKNFGSENELEYTAQWTAPLGSDGEESIFYVSAMLVNGNGSPSGDTYVSVQKKYTIAEEQAELQVMVTAQSDALCQGESNGMATVTASGGTGTYTYDWDNGESTATATMLSEGLHSVTVADGTNGAEVFVTIGDGDAIEANIAVIQSVECQGQSNGILLGSAFGGAEPYNFTWNTGDNGATIEDLPPGLYSVTIVDTNGCTGVGDITLFSADVTGPDLEVVESIDLFLTEDVSIIDINSLDNIVVSSSDNCSDELTIDWAPKSFDCDDVGQNDLIITASDQAGNRTTKVVVVDVIDQVSPRLVCLSDILNISSCAPFSYLAPFVEDNCDNFRLELVSGQGINNEFPLGESRELYMVTDRSGNTATCEIIINNQPDINVDVEVMDISCASAADGSAQFFVSGQNSPFSVELDGIVTPENLEEGLYTFTVMDFTGCSIIGSFEINEPEPILIKSADITPPTNSNSGDGDIDITVEGGTPPYSYSWVTENEFFSDNEDLQLLFPGEYMVEVTDASGCVVTSETYLLEEVTSINDPVIDAAISLFPNPSTNYLIVDIKKLEFDRANATILSITGQEVFQQDLLNPTERLKINHLPEGFYVIKLKLDDNIITRTIWKLDD